jgi:hypothetical protein
MEAIDILMTDLAPTQRIVLLQSLGNTPARLSGMLDQLAPEAEFWRAAPDEWTLRETVSHLAAAEAPFLQRLRRIQAEDSPFLPYFGPDVARPDDNCPLEAGLARFRSERERLLTFLADVAPEAWERPAVHETMGPTNFSLQVQNLISHDLEHLGQVHKAQAAWNERQHA